MTISQQRDSANVCEPVRCYDYDLGGVEEVDATDLDSLEFTYDTQYLTAVNQLPSASFILHHQELQ